MESSPIEPWPPQVTTTTGTRSARLTNAARGSSVRVYAMASMLFGMKAYSSDRPVRSSGRHCPLASQPASPNSLAPLAFALASQGSAVSSRLTKPTLVARRIRHQIGNGDRRIVGMGHHRPIPLHGQRDR